MPETTASASGIRVLACQIAVPPIDSVQSREAHLRQTAERLGRALDRQHADLVVLPELSGLSYSRETFARLSELSEPLEGPSASVYAKLAARHRTRIAFGIARRDGEAVLISHVVVDPDGHCLGCYDKLHMAQFGASMEKDYFSPGDHLFVFEVEGIRVSAVICYDFRFPDLVTTLCRDHDVRLVIHPVAFYRDGSFPSWHHIASARAVENQVYFLSLNRAGEEYGDSVWCPPWVDDALQPERFGTDEELRYFTVDSDLIERIRAEYPFGRDRLADYRGIRVERANG